MRSAVLSVAVFVLAIGAFRFLMPSMLGDTVGGSESCDDTHLTSKDLDAFVPDDSAGLRQVYRAVAHCKSGDFASEAELNLAYAADGSVEETAQSLLAGADRAGWTRVSPASGKAVATTNGTANLSLRRTEHGQTVRFDAYVFPAASKQKPDPNANITKIQASGSPTGVLLRIWVEGKSAIPTIDAGKLGTFATPAIGIGR